MIGERIIIRIKITSDIISVSFLAQCLISTILKKPDYARARPSTILADDNTYKLLYLDNQDLEVFYKAARIGQKIKENLKSTPNMTQAERSDVLFYLVYAVIAKKIGKNNITFNDVKTLDLGLLSDDDINDVKDAVYTKYKELGGNGRVAKSESFIHEVDMVIGL